MAHISLSPITNHDYIVVSNMFMKQPASSDAFSSKCAGFLLNHVETTRFSTTFGTSGPGGASGSGPKGFPKNPDVQ